MPLQDLIDFRLDHDALQSFAKANALAFEHADPFPHIVVPDVLPVEVARAIAAEFPPIADRHWLLEGPGMAKHSGDPNVEKVSMSDERWFPPLIRHVMHEFNSATMVAFLATLTGMDRLIVDPSFGGCGLHSTGRGGRLMIHADSDRHPNPQLHQIFNMIYYATPDWQPEWGGGLELWDKTGKTLVKTVTPAFNSMVIFFTGSRSFHGHPHPITCPPGIRRNSLAAYYYTTERAVGEDYTGYTRRVTWVPTSEHDTPSLKHRVKEAVKRRIPARYLRKYYGVLAALDD